MNNVENTNCAGLRKPSKSNKLNLRVNDEELEILHTISFEDDEPISQVVRKAIKQYNMLRRNKNQF